MISSESCAVGCLPGFDSLRSEDRKNEFIPHDPELLENATKADFPYRALLTNKTYKRYIKTPKGVAADASVHRLLGFARELEKEQTAEYLESAGGAFAEAALANSEMRVKKRLEILDKADECYMRAIRAYDGQEKTDFADIFRDDSKPFRLALNLAYTPLIRSIVLGDVTDEVRRQSMTDTLAIAELAEVHRQFAMRDGEQTGTCELYGFMHECNVLVAFLHLDNPAYVPVPSFPRADSGYFHKSHTHDIALINQRFGIIKKIIPIEAKKERHKNSVRRYDALLMTRDDIAPSVGDKSIESTLHLFSNIFNGSATETDHLEFKRIKSRVRNRIREYQRLSPSPNNHDSTPTRFYGDRSQRIMAFRAMQAAELSGLAAG